MTFAKYPVTGGGGGGGTGDVVGPASSTDNALAVWDGATGKLLKNSSVLVGNVVAGPASATDGVVVLFDGTTGKLIKNSSIVAANIVAGPASATDSAVVLFDGTTGKLVKNSTLSASTIVLTSGNQTVGGTKTFSSQILAPTVNFTNSSNQMVFGSGTFKTTISAPGAPAADLTYTFPNIQAVSLTGTVSLLEAANQTFSGSGTIFSQTVRFDSSSPLFLGAFPNRIALSPGSQASPRTWLFPDLTVDPTFAALEGTQSFSGNKTFSGTLTVPATVSFTGLNSITKAGNFAHTLTTTATSNSTFPSGTQTLAALDLGQTWSAIQTHSAAIAFTGGTAANASIWFASNVLRQRGGTSGWAVDNTSGTAIISATDAGAVTLGVSTQTNPFHTLNSGVVSKARSANETGSYSARQFLQLSAGSTWSADAHIATRTQTGYQFAEISHDGSGGLYNNTVDAQTSGSALVSTNQKAILSWTGAGAWTVGPASAIGGSTFPGASIVGRTDGSAPAAGYVGQSVEGTQTTPTNFPTTATWGDGTSVTLTSGRWLLFAMLDSDNNGATGTSILMGISTTSGNSGSGLTFGDTLLATLFPTGVSDVSIVIPALVRNITASTTYYLKVRAEYSAGVPRYRCRLTAIRIA